MNTDISNEYCNTPKGLPYSIQFNIDLHLIRSYIAKEIFEHRDAEVQQDLAKWTMYNDLKKI